MKPHVKVLHICQTGATGLVFHGPTFGSPAATWFAWGRRPHSIRMVAHGYLPTANHVAYEAAIRAELDRLSVIVAEPIE